MCLCADCTLTVSDKEQEYVMELGHNLILTAQLKFLLYPPLATGEKYCVEQ